MSDASTEKTPEPAEPSLESLAEMPEVDPSKLCRRPGRGHHAHLQGGELLVAVDPDLWAYLGSSEATISNGQAAVLGRVIRPERDDLSADAARSILMLDFDEQDRVRMRELAVKAQQGALAGADEAELASYRGVGRLLELMRSKARLSLKRAGLEP